jgi:hypothetical protein
MAETGYVCSSFCFRMGAGGTCQYSFMRVHLHSPCSCVLQSDLILFLLLTLKVVKVQVNAGVATK